MKSIGIRINFTSLQRSALECSLDAPALQKTTSTQSTRWSGPWAAPPLSVAWLRLKDWSNSAGLLIFLAITAPTQASLRFAVTWAGIDTGSGLRHYQVQVKAQGEVEWSPWLTATSQTSAPFRGPEQSYLFRVRAPDNVNNISDWVESGPVEIVSVTKYYHFDGGGWRCGKAVWYTISVNNNQL